MPGTFYPYTTIINSKHRDENGKLKLMVTRKRGRPGHRLNIRIDAAMGFVYKTGWLSGRDKSATDQFDPLEFKPKLKLGGRMPQFWLDDKDGQQISVLDLP